MLGEQQGKDFMVELEKQSDIARAIWLNELRRGQGFPTDSNPTILFKKNEKSVFKIHNISLSENRSVRTGSYGGSRVRVAKGISVGGGRFKSQYHDELTKIDVGTLILTNQRIVFVGKTHSSDIPLKKIVSIEPYKNAIVVGKEGKAKSQQFTGTDKSSFTVTVNNRAWKIPAYGIVIKAMVEGLNRAY